MERRAVLIQNLAGFVAELEPHYSAVLQRHILRRPDLEREFLQWVMRHLIEEVYYLTDRNFYKNEPLYCRMFQDLANALPFSIEHCFAHYIEAPHIYPDNFVVEIRVVGERILTIHFITETPQYRQR